MSQNKNNQTVFWSGLLLGSSIATLVSLLLAPRTGKETRQIVQKSASALPEMANDLTTTLQDHSNRIVDSWGQNWQQGVNRLQVAISAGVKASQNYRQESSRQN